MAAQSEHHEAETKRNPLIPVGLTVLAILAIPLGIYSFGPEGPIKKNHVVFSTGQHRAHFAEGSQYDDYRGYCILQARDQLLVLESAEDRGDGSYLAQMLGTRKQEFPACPLAITRNPVRAPDHPKAGHLGRAAGCPYPVLFVGITPSNPASFTLSPPGRGRKAKIMRRFSVLRRIAGGILRVWGR